MLMVMVVELGDVVLLLSVYLHRVRRCLRGESNSAIGILHYGSCGILANRLTSCMLVAVRTCVEERMEVLRGMRHRSV